jgi:hypothetical protein
MKYFCSFIINTDQAAGNETVQTRNGCYFSSSALGCCVAGILARLTENDEKDLAKMGYSMIRIVVCNLYPFVDTVAKPDVTIADAVENIDIGA